MQKRVFIIVSFLCVYFLQAQDSLNVKVSYIMEINRNNTYQVETSPKINCDLYIQNGESKFNIYYEEARNKYGDQVPSFNLYVYKNFNTNEMYGRAIGYRQSEYVIKDSLNIIEWNLQDSTKTIQGKICKLATVHWRDFDWEAWYDESIPISEGPYKLHGLPGLILEAKAKSCAGTIITFTMNTIEFTHESLEKLIYFPFTNKEYKFIDYSTMYADVSKDETNFLKNNYLEGKEKYKNSDIIIGPTCVSNDTFDYCFCYPEKEKN